MNAVVSWLKASRRNRLIAVAAASAVAAAAVAVPVALSGSGRKTAPDVAAPRTQGCRDARSIERPADAAAGGAWSRLTLPAGTPCYTLVASSKDAGGIAPKATFTLAAKDPIEPAALLAVTPKIGFTVEPVAKASDGASRYRIVPDKPLDRGVVYRFSLLDSPDGRPVRSWAFQVQNLVRVVQTLPADEATDVPLDTGVEITFSVDGVRDVDRHFTITPTTAGRFETHKRTVVFVPKSLAAQTLYTVRVAKGVGAAGADSTLDRDVVFRFETGRAGRAEPPRPLTFARPAWESRVADPPALGLFAGERPPSSLRITVYRLASAEEFVSSLDAYAAIPRWAEHARDRFAATTSGLTQVTSFTAKLERLGEFGGLYLRFPRPLPAGYYLVKGSTEPNEIQTWLQVTDLATYTSVSKGRTLVWVNDLATRRPVAGARITVAARTQAGSAAKAAATSPAATTGADGVAFFDTPKEMLTLEPSAFGEQATVVRSLIVDAAGRTTVVPLSEELEGHDSFPFREYLFEGNPAPWWRFLYTDRHLYRPTDEINFWGLVRAREGALSERRLDVEIDFGWDSTEPVARTTVTTTRTGTFIGRIGFEALSVGYYSLEVKLDGATVASTSFSVEDFVKPAYKIDVTPSRRGVFAGERVAFDVSTAFFEGTPVPGVQLRHAGLASGTLTTDDDGHATTTATLGSESPYGDYNWETLSVTPVLAEEGSITGSASVQVFRAAVGFDADGRIAAGRGTVSGTAYRIDPSRVEDGDPDAYKTGPAAGVGLTAAVTEYYYKCSRQADRYDFVAKRVVRFCDTWDRVDTSRGTHAATTDARGRFTFSFPVAADRGYDVKVSGVDAAKRRFENEVYLASAIQPNTDFLSLVPESDGPFAIGDTVSATLRRGAQVLPSGGDNRYLFALAQNGLRSVSVAAAPAHSFRFAAEHAPTVTLIAVRFGGSGYEEVMSGYTAVFDRESRRLRVAVEAEKDRYRPGENARLTLRVTDASGKPVKAEVLVSAVDEAIFRLEGQEFFGNIDMLDDLYSWLPSGILAAYSSHQHPSAVAGGEHGGEGPARDTFKDTGLFTRVTTGADGRAVVPFPLPDNLTSWRVSALAVTDGLSAGSGTGAVAVGRDVFVEAALGTHYLASDKPNVRLRAFGTALRAGAPVTFTISATGLAAAPLTRSGTAFRPLDVPLPALKEGVHEIRITVEGAGRRDTLVRTITVVASRLTAAKTTVRDLRPSERYTPPGSKTGRTTVVLADHNRGRYVPALESLASGGGDRADQALARILARELLVEHFKRPNPDPEVFVASRYQTEDGGVGIFPYADDDLTMSARLADVAAGRFDRSRLAVFFGTVLADDESSRERQIVALYGMAALGEPVLDEVRAAAAERNLSWREQLYVALGAAALGDDDTARTIYQGLLRRYGETRGAAARLRVGVDNDDVLEATSLAAVVGASIGDDLAAALFDTTTTTATRDILVELERIAFLTRALPNLPADPVTVSYVAAGKRTTTTLEDGESVALDLGPKDLAALDLRVESGTLGVVSSYAAPLDPKTVKADPDVRIRRTYEGKAPGRVAVADGEIVRVRLAFTIGAQSEDSCYQITDLLPSGLRPVSAPYARGLPDDGSIDYPYAVEGQRVSFCVGRDSTRTSISYYARVVTTGAYTAEPVVIQSQRAPESIAIDGGFPVTIR